MDRYRCTKCNEEFFLKVSCGCCNTDGPHFCPECGGLLHKIASSYVCSSDFDEE